MIWQIGVLLVVISILINIFLVGKNIKNILIILRLILRRQQSMHDTLNKLDAEVTCVANKFLIKDKGKE